MDGLCGQSARNAAQLLAPHSITKQQQLLLAAEWPDARSRREECKTELRALKESRLGRLTGLCSWEYFAGFFDAEGYIHQHRTEEPRRFYGSIKSTLES